MVSWLEDFSAFAGGVKCVFLFSKVCTMSVYYFHKQNISHSHSFINTDCGLCLPVAVSRQPRTWEMGQESRDPQETPGGPQQPPTSSHPPVFQIPGRAPGSVVPAGDIISPGCSVSHAPIFYLPDSLPATQPAPASGF